MNSTKRVKKFENILISFSLQNHNSLGKISSVILNHFYKFTFSLIMKYFWFLIQSCSIPSAFYAIATFPTISNHISKLKRRIGSVCFLTMFSPRSFTFLGLIVYQMRTIYKTDLFRLCPVPPA